MMMRPAELVALVKQQPSLIGDVEPALVLAICERESGLHDATGCLVGFNESAFANDRNGGSYGLMQIDVPSARDRGFKGAPSELYIPATNLIYGTKHLAWGRDFLKMRGAGGLQATIAAYNEGVGNALRGNPDPRYVGAVMGYLATWRLQLTGTSSA